MTAPKPWPAIPYRDWRDTCATLHRWTQIVGKVRLAKTPWLNHSWQVALYLSCRGLTTSPIPDGRRTFQIDFDFIDHALLIQTSDGLVRRLPLARRTVADFYAAVRQALAELAIRVVINEKPCEIPDPDAIPFSQDLVHNAYDADAARRFWLALVQIDRVFKRFRTGFIGKASPVHFFWGSFDLAVTRFSGRTAPPHPGGVPNLPDAVTREAYSHEVSSVGFWPGGGPVDYPAFYAYAYPIPAGFDSIAVRPEAAFYHTQAGEFILPYDAVRDAADPDETLLQFLQSTYEAAADTADWDRGPLDSPLGKPGLPRPVSE